MNLTSYGVQELNTREVREIEGGWWQYLALWLAWEAATNPNDTWAALQEGFNSYERQ